MGCTDEIAMVRLQQGFVTSEMGFNSEVTRQQTKSRSCPLWVISGHSAQDPKADIATGTRELWMRLFVRIKPARASAL